MAKKRYSRRGAKAYQNKRLANFRGKSRVHAQIQKPLSARDDLYKITTMRQYHSQVVVDQAAGADTTFGMACVISGMGNLTNYQGLWDQYRIDYLEFTFNPQYRGTSQASVGGTLVNTGMIYTAIDKDSSTASPNTIDGIRQYAGCESHNGYQTFTIRFKPGVRSDVWTGSVGVAGGREISPWIDLAQTGIQHYGLVGATTGQIAASTLLQRWIVDTYVGISFRAVR